MPALSGNAEGGDVLVSIAAEITDNESTDESNPLVFVEGADPDGGDLPLETDGTCIYNHSDGIFITTGFVATDDVQANSEVIGYAL